MRKVVISAFLSFQLLLVVCILFPIFDWQKSLSEYFGGYIAFIGLDQSYSVFTPKPKDENLHLVAVVEHADGSEELWPYPRLEKLPIFKRMSMERYRKFGLDNLAQPRFKNLWPDFARYIARQTNAPGNPPIMVSVLRFSSPIPPPYGNLKLPLPQQSDLTTLFSYRVKPEDLQ